MGIDTASELIKVLIVTRYRTFAYFYNLKVQKLHFLLDIKVQMMHTNGMKNGDREPSPVTKIRSRRRRLR